LDNSNSNIYHNRFFSIVELVSNKLSENVFVAILESSKLVSLLIDHQDTKKGKGGRYFVACGKADSSGMYFKLSGDIYYSLALSWSILFFLEK
jgi:hypothetical protein